MATANKPKEHRESAILSAAWPAGSWVLAELFAALFGLLAVLLVVQRQEMSRDTGVRSLVVRLDASPAEGEPLAGLLQVGFSPETAFGPNADAPLLQWRGDEGEITVYSDSTATNGKRGWVVLFRLAEIGESLAVRWRFEQSPTAIDLTEYTDRRENARGQREHRLRPGQREIVLRFSGQQLLATPSFEVVDE